MPLNKQLNKQNKKQTNKLMHDTFLNECSILNEIMITFPNLEYYKYYIVF